MAAFCRQCGRPNPGGAKFCGECGAAAVAETPVGGRFVPMITLPVGANGVLASRVPPCAHCGSSRPLAGYFSRAANIVKLVVAAWFWVWPAVVYYLARRDRLLCADCGRWRGSAAALEAAAAMWMGQIASSASGSMALILPPRDESAELALREAATRKRSAVVWGIASAVFVALAVGSGAGFVAGAVTCGGWAAFQLVRGSKLQQAGDNRKKRHEALRILQLAKTHGGRLSVTDVAASLAMDMGEAERALDALVDGTHVEMNVDDEGRVRYVFTELVAP